MNGASASLMNWTHIKIYIAAIVLFILRLYSKEIRTALEWPFRHLGRQVAAQPVRIQKSLEFAQQSAYNLTLFLAWNVLNGVFLDVWAAIATNLVNVKWLHLPNLFFPLLLGYLTADVWRMRSYVKELFKMAQAQNP